MSRALVIGEALIDIVERAGRVTEEHVGGSPLNVAVGLSRLGRDVDFLTHIGDDARGRRIADYVAASGAHLLDGSIRARRTPIARAMLDGAGAATYKFDSTGSWTARRKLIRHLWCTPGQLPPFSSPAVEPSRRCSTPTVGRRQSRSTPTCVQR